MNILRTKVGTMAALATLLFLISSGPAGAIPFIDFDAAPPTPGSVSYAGGANPLVGTGIGVDIVVGTNGTPSNNNVPLTLFHSTGQGTFATHGFLNFTSGNLTGFDAGDYFFGGNPSLTAITLVGGVDLNRDGIFGNAGDIPDGTTLFSGRITSMKVTLGQTSLAVIDAFADTKNRTLLTFYGMPDIPYAGGMNLGFVTGGSFPVPPGAFTSQMMTSGDVTNTPTTEPISLILLGTGLTGVGLYRRFRRLRG